jgi:hypothetical protein
VVPRGLPSPPATQTAQLDNLAGPYSTHPIPDGTSLYALFAEAVFSRTLLFSYAARAAKTFSRFPYDQSMMASRMGTKLQPSSEMLYSTFGGTVAAGNEITQGSKSTLRV